MRVIKRRNKLMTMNRIVMASATMIAERGVDKAGINAIADHAHVNKVLIYRYFSGWNGVIEALFEQILTKIKASLPVVESPTQPNPLTLDAYIVKYYKELQTNLAFQGLLYWLISNKETELARRLIILQNQSIEQVAGKMDPIQVGMLRLLLAGITHSVLTGDNNASVTEQVIHRIYEKA